MCHFLLSNDPSSGQNRAVVISLFFSNQLFANAEAKRTPLCDNVCGLLLKTFKATLSIYEFACCLNMFVVLILNFGIKSLKQAFTVIGRRI